VATSGGTPLHGVFILPRHVKDNDKAYVQGRLVKFQEESARVPIGIYDEPRLDVLRLSEVPCDRVAIQRVEHGYSGIIESGKSYYLFSMNSKGFITRPVDSANKALSMMDKLLESEQLLSLEDRQEEASEEQARLNEKMSQPTHVIVYKSANTVKLGPSKEIGRTGGAAPIHAPHDRAQAKFKAAHDAGSSKTMKELAHSHASGYGGHLGYSKENHSEAAQAHKKASGATTGLLSKFHAHIATAHSALSGKVSKAEQPPVEPAVVLPRRAVFRKWRKATQVFTPVDACVFQDEHGGRWFGKSDTTESLGLEHIATQIYRLFGIASPETKLVSLNGNNWLMSKAVAGSVKTHKALGNTDAADGFLVDVWLSNSQVEFHVDGREAVRTNNQYALGNLEVPVGELESYRTTDLYRSLRDADISAQIKQFDGHWTANISNIEKLVRSSGLTPGMKDKVWKGLKLRAEWIIDTGILSKGDLLLVTELPSQRPTKQSSTKLVVKAVPKKDATDKKVKKTKPTKHSKKAAGSTGKTRYTYPGEKGGDKKLSPKPASKTHERSVEDSPPNQPAEPEEVEGETPRQQVPVPIPEEPVEYKADAEALAQQIGIPVDTLKDVAARFRDKEEMGGREGFSNFMLTHLKGFTEKHELDGDYWGLVYDNLLG
jgi:hypothetical protein